MAWTAKVVRFDPASDGVQVGFRGWGGAGGRRRGAGAAGPPRGFSPPEAEPALLARIRRAAPDILLVAFGAPRQEDWMRRYGASLSVPVTMGVGGTLDVLAGRTGRAPRWGQAAGLEWLYRMGREPWGGGGGKTLPLPFFLAVRGR